MSYRHGVYVSERSTSMVTPINGAAGLQVVIGTAPVHMTENPEAAINTPILVHTYKEAVEAMGYSDEFDKYTICEAISASFQVLNVAPLVLINVLDPAKHNTALTTAQVNVVDGVAIINETGIIKSSLTVKNGDTALTEGEDYAVTINEDGTASIAVIAGGAAAGAATLNITGTKVDPSKVTAADIVGGVEARTGKETGMEVIRQVYPKLGMTPGILIAPRFSKHPEVSAAIQAKTHDIDGVFKAACIVDLDSSSDGATKYTDVNAQKTAQALTDPNAYAVWLYGKVGDKIYSGSSLAAALTAYTDAANDDTPNLSPSNKPINISGVCLADGTEVLLDQDQANTVNGFGVATWLNMNGFRLWGNNTVAYPGNTDPKDRFFACRRFMNWRGNSFILTYFQKVDDPLNPRLVEAVVDSENVRGNGYVARGVCARDEIVYVAEDNPVTQLMDGKIVFNHYMTPYTPAEVIEDKIEFDPNALTRALG